MYLFQHNLNKLLFTSLFHGRNFTCHLFFSRLNKKQPVVGVLWKRCTLLCGWYSCEIKVFLYCLQNDCSCTNVLFFHDECFKNICSRAATFRSTSWGLDSSTLWLLGYFGCSFCFTNTGTISCVIYIDRTYPNLLDTTCDKKNTVLVFWVFSFLCLP